MIFLTPGYVLIMYQLALNHLPPRDRFIFRFNQTIYWKPFSIFFSNLQRVLPSPDRVILRLKSTSFHSVAHSCSGGLRCRPFAFSRYGVKRRKSEENVSNTEKSPRTVSHTAAALK